jgi:NAD(P)-dependent dehydrogenase (short-subunit alcohol dehydrogenase family)
VPAECHQGKFKFTPTTIGKRSLWSAADYVTRCGLRRRWRNAVGYTQAVSIHNIRVNAIAAGYIHSEMTDALLASESGQEMIANTPQQRAGNPEDLDSALLLLCSDASSFMTGSTITVDGGHMQTSL